MQTDRVPHLNVWSSRALSQVGESKTQEVRWLAVAVDSGATVVQAGGS